MCALTTCHKLICIRLMCVFISNTYLSEIVYIERRFFTIRHVIIYFWYQSCSLDIFHFQPLDKKISY